MRGETTTIKETKAERTLHKVIKRNATLTELLQAQVQQVGQTFQADCAIYEIIDVREDTIHRLIAIGRLVEHKT